MALVKLLGEKLLNKSGELIDVTSLVGEGKVVGLYFSAHWCGPCRNFTPKLSEFHNTLKLGEKKDVFEIVFVSSDRDEQAFDEYYKSMPWLALPFADRSRKNKLSSKFKVRGIPTLVFVDSVTGNSVITSGREKVMSDPEGVNFPWKPKEFAEILGSVVQNNAGADIATETLKGKHLCLYFSAHWCPPCKTFTPALVETYKKIKERGVEMEMIFVTFDRSEESFKDYYSKMPWLTIPYADEERRKEMAQVFEINGIPALVVLDENWKLITSSGRESVKRDPEGKEFPWLPKPVNELNEGTSSPINEEPCVVYFTSSEAENVDSELAMMEPIAASFIEKAKVSGDDVPIFFVGGSDEIVCSLLEFLKVKDEELPLLAVLDIPEQRWYRAPDKEITAEVITSVTQKFLDDELEFQVLSGK
ncbi:nucleoredoxin-like [Anneissia japonica]|uniref:nucleoredoxin-like n=1 Tax=Anneissia japonica TaxID=1529436 RepID=UPI0014259AF5|nr:nucleoredoxin-like [Anneissia japonica]